MERPLLLKIVLLFTFVFYPGILFPQNKVVQSLLDSLSIENIETHIDSLCRAGGYETRSTFTKGNEKAAKYIYSYFKSLPGLSGVKLDTFFITNSLYPYSTYPQFNVVAFQEGESDSSDIILIGGHYDTSGSRETGYDENWNTTFKARGADDNATGVAAVMEIARVLSDAGSSFNNKHTLKFIAFGAEESHPVHKNASHVGSLFDAGNMYDDGEPLAAAIILDMIGYNNNYNYTEVISDQASTWLANQIYGYWYIYLPHLHINSTPTDIPYSDHKSYQDYGFSAILLMENDRPWNDDSPYYLSNPYYHTSSDMPSTLNFTQVGMVAKLALAGAASMSLRDDPTSVDRNTRNLDDMPENFQLSAYPNPFNGRVNIQFRIFKEDEINIAIFNILGQKIQTLYPGDEFKTGLYNISWDAGSNPSGVYYCVFRTNYGMKSLQLMFIK